MALPHLRMARERPGGAESRSSLAAENLPAQTIRHLLGTRNTVVNALDPAVSQRLFRLAQRSVVTPRTFIRSHRQVFYILLTKAIRYIERVGAESRNCNPINSSTST
jgi:hypothetical protein